MKKIPQTWWSKAREQGMTEEAKARTEKLLHTSFFTLHICKQINRKNNFKMASQEDIGFLPSI